MKSYDILKEWESFSPELQRQSMGYFLGGIGMDYEGFTDSKERSSYPHAKYVMEQLDKTMIWARAQYSINQRSTNTSTAQKNYILSSWDVPNPIVPETRWEIPVDGLRLKSIDVVPLGVWNAVKLRLPRFLRVFFKPVVWNVHYVYGVKR